MSKIIFFLLGLTICSVAICKEVGFKHDVEESVEDDGKVMCIVTAILNFLSCLKKYIPSDSNPEAEGNLRDMKATLLKLAN
ncbi:unnamed protein product [Colias eurytheme]|nr:unnamed protein product [Colias eurytheme]